MTNAKYKESSFGAGIIRLEDGATIPFDIENPDYKEFLAYKKSGGAIAPADELPNVVTT